MLHCRKSVGATSRICDSPSAPKILDCGVTLRPKEHVSDLQAITNNLIEILQTSGGLTFGPCG